MTIRLRDYRTTWLYFKLDGFGDQSWAKASGTDLHMDGPSLFQGLYLVKIGVPDFSGLVMRMADIMSKDRPFSTDIAYFCHNLTSRLIRNKITQPDKKCKRSSSFLYSLLNLRECVKNGFGSSSRHSGESRNPVFSGYYELTGLRFSPEWRLEPNFFTASGWMSGG